MKSWHGRRMNSCQICRHFDWRPALTGTGVICETWALEVAVMPVPPWREESTRQTFGNARSTDWIPALRQAQGKLFAGMTTLADNSSPLPWGEGGPRPAFSPAGAGRVRG